jgi:hypothetical protein
MPAGSKMMAAISRNFDLDQSSNLLARSTYELFWSLWQFAFWGEPKPIPPVR